MGSCGFRVFRVLGFAVSGLRASRNMPGGTRHLEGTEWQGSSLKEGSYDNTKRVLSAPPHHF